MNRAVIYARYSSTGQTEQSIEGQLRDCYKVAEEQGLTIVKEYIDRALTGKNDNRPNFKRMIKDSAFDNFDVVITWKMDRFARNRTDSALYKKILKDNGVKVVYAAENIPDGNEGVILESILEGLAEYYSLDLAQKTIRGKKESIRKGKHANGTVLYGYKTNKDKYYEIDENAAPIIRKIFNDYVSGKTPSEIARSFNEAGIKTKIDDIWTPSKIHQILKNKKYAGIYECFGVKSNSAIPAIIDLKTFEAAQKKATINKNIGGKNKARYKYMLSGKIQCGICGSAMCGNYARANRKVKVEIICYYTCNAKRSMKKLDCTSKSIRRDLVEKLVIENTMNIVLDDNFINKIASQIIELNEKQDETDNLIDVYNYELKDVKSKIDNIMKAIEEGIASKRMIERIAELEERESQLEQQISIESSKQKQDNLTKEQIIFWLSSFKDGNIESVEFCENLIKCFINKVVVYPGYIEVYYNYLDEENRKMLISTTPNVLDTVSPIVIRLTQCKTVYIGKNQLYLEIKLP